MKNRNVNRNHRGSNAISTRRNEMIVEHVAQALLEGNFHLGIAPEYHGCCGLLDQLAVPGSCQPIRRA
jgi:hypothetical protein